MTQKITPVAPYNGAILINKPSGPTSHDIVAMIRRITGQKSVGHTGTLDPLASGLMVILMGEATKCSDLILNANKTYLATVKFGLETDTLDITGQTIATSDVSSLTQDQMMTAAGKLKGVLKLRIPWFSAVKVNGQKFYEKAREMTLSELTQLKADLPVREMEFHQVDVLATTADTLQVRLGCSKGSYIRSWIQELGEILGCGATMSALEREESGLFCLKNAITLEDLTNLGLKGLLTEQHPSVIPLESLLPAVKGCLANGKEEALIHHGQIPRGMQSRLLPEVRLANSSREEITIKVLSGQERRLVALLVAKPGQGLKFKRVFSY